MKYSKQLEKQLRKNVYGEYIKFGDKDTFESYCKFILEIQFELNRNCL